MNLALLPLVALVTATAAFVQGSVGFGFGMVAIPVLLRLGLSLPYAIALAVGGSTAQTALGLWRGRAHVEPRLSLKVAAGQWVGIPVGVAAMFALDEAGGHLVERVVGAAVLLSVALRAVRPPRPRAHVGGVWSAVVGVTSGILGGGVGMGAPPLVLFALAHDWPPDRFRIFLWSQFLLATPWVLALFGWRYGMGVLGAWALGMALAPAVWLGGAAGRRVAAGWDEEVVGRAASALLVIIGLRALFA